MSFSKWSEDFLQTLAKSVEEQNSILHKEVMTELKSLGSTMHEDLEEVISAIKGIGGDFVKYSHPLLLDGAGQVDGIPTEITVLGTLEPAVPGAVVRPQLRDDSQNLGPRLVRAENHVSEVEIWLGQRVQAGNTGDAGHHDSSLQDAIKDLVDFFGSYGGYHNETTALRSVAVLAGACNINHAASGAVMFSDSSYSWYDSGIKLTYVVNYTY